MEIRERHFGGQANVHGEGFKAGTLANLMGDLLAFRAAHVVETAGHAAVTDNSSGTAEGMKALAIPDAAYDGTGDTSNAAKAGSDTALDEVNDACAVLMDTADDVATLLGLAGDRGEGNGTIAVADTVAAISADSGAAVAAAGAVGFASAVAELGKVRDNLTTVAWVVEKLEKAVLNVSRKTGADHAAIGGSVLANDDLVNLAAGITADGDGTTSVSKAVMDAFIANARDDVAELAERLDAVIAAAPSTGVPTVIAVP